MSDQYCKDKSYHGRMGSLPCGKKATRDGYCAVHHPDAVAARRKKSDERYAQLREKKEAAWLAEKERRRAYEALERERDELRTRVNALEDFLRRVMAADALVPIIDGTRYFEYDLMQGFSDEARALLAGDAGAKEGGE